jgi:hypothetical protein
MASGYKMKYLNTTVRKRVGPAVARVSHACNCGDKDFRHDKQTKACRVDDCGCRNFVCKKHGLTCDAGGYFVSVATPDGHSFAPFKVSDKQILQVCDDCGLILGHAAFKCVKRKPTAKTEALPPLDNSQA